MFFKKKTQTEAKAKKNVFEVISEYIQALAGAILLAILIRGFLFEPFKIPSESMVPTLLVGDHIFVARYQYGLRVPFTKYWLTEFDGPKRGDVVVFSYPEDEDVDFIKRVVGLPGDTVSMEGGRLFINGEEIRQKEIQIAGLDPQSKRILLLTPESQKMLPESMVHFPYYHHYEEYQPKIEILDGPKYHYIQRSKYMPLESDFELVVPERHYFVLGDNRDQSQDSRFWGFVPRENLKGRAIFIWLSLDNDRGGVRWNRFGEKIN